jgi:hypothetical protein
MITAILKSTRYCGRGGGYARATGSRGRLSAGERVGGERHREAEEI